MAATPHPIYINLFVTCGFKKCTPHFLQMVLQMKGENVAQFLGIPTILLGIAMNLLHSFSTGTSYPFHPKWEPVIWGAGHHFLLSHYGPGTCYLLGLGTLQLVLLFPERFNKRSRAKGQRTCFVLTENLGCCYLVALLKQL